MILHATRQKSTLNHWKLIALLLASLASPVPSTDDPLQNCTSRSLSQALGLRVSLSLTLGNLSLGLSETLSLSLSLSLSRFLFNREERKGRIEKEEGRTEDKRGK
jgi:hypothetical protein